MPEPVGKPSPQVGLSNDKSSQPPLSGPGDLSWLRKTSRPLRILVAEDTRAFQEIVKAILGQRGHQIEMVGTGRDAVERCQQAEFDVILMDVHMPTMDGLQATIAIRHNIHPPRSGVPIIGMSAHTLLTSLESRRSIGMNDFVAKPFDPGELVRLVELHGGRQRTASDDTSSDS